MRSTAFAILSLACVGLLSACNNGASFYEEEDEVVVIPPGDPTSVTLLVSSPQIPSSATQSGDGVQLLATVRDINNNGVAGVTVAFSTPDAGMRVGPSPDPELSNVTDANGLASAELLVFSDKSNRTVPVTASVTTENGVVVGTVNVQVTGTTLSISGPTAGQGGTAANYVATLTDAAGAGITGANIVFTSAQGTFEPSDTGTTTITSNSNGQATAIFTPTSNASLTSATVTAAALGLTAAQNVSLSQDSFLFQAPNANAEINVGATPTTVTVRWRRGGSGVAGATVTFSTTRGTLSSSTDTTDVNGDATITITSAQAGVATISASGTDGAITVTANRSVEFVATTPANISVQPDPTTLSVGNTSTLRAIVRDAASNFVKNQVVNFTIDQGPGTLSSATAITDSQGVAVVTYSATSTSGAGGVVVSATVSGTNVTDSATLTVGGNALRLVLGTGNTMSELGTTLYSVPYSVIVTDSSGNAVANKTVNLSLHAMTYSKGTSEFQGFWVRTDGNGAAPTTCINEDLLSPDENLQLDGILNDPNNEDVDGDGHLDPENVGSVPNSVTTNAQGIADFAVVYPQDRAYWVKVRLRATVAVGGSEALQEVFFQLPGIASDFNNASIAPPGVDSPYGVIQDCTVDDNNAPSVQFATGSTTRTEATGTIAITVTATPASGVNLSQDVVVPLNYDDNGTDTADFSVDYTGPSSVTIPSGSNQATFNVTVVNDTNDESDEQLSITLGQPSNALVGNRDTHTVTITDNDP